MTVVLMDADLFSGLIAALAVNASRFRDPGADDLLVAKIDYRMTGLVEQNIAAAHLAEVRDPDPPVPRQVIAHVAGIGSTAAAWGASGIEAGMADGRDDK